MSEQQTTERAKHTPGPWRAERVFAIDGDMDIENWKIIAGERNSIAYTTQSNTSVSSEENLANARLIASSPEMLSALLAAENALKWYGNVDRVAENAVKKIRAALAKAKGTTE